MCKILLILIIGGIGVLTVFASPANNRIQEAAYILSIGDTAKAENMLNSALVLPNVSVSEKLNAHLYLARIAEARLDTLGAVEHYNFLKNNSQNASLAYMAANRKKLLGASEEKIKIANEKTLPAKEDDKIGFLQDSRFLNCNVEGELSLAQRMVYNCPDNSLHLISKNKGAEPWSIPFFTDMPAKVFLIFDGLFLYYENWLYFYRLGDGLNQAWRIPTLEVQDMEDIGDKIYVLDISGKISLLNKNSGRMVSVAKSDGENFFKPGTGLIGTYQKNGGISVFDTLLNNLWNYQIDGEIASNPTVKADSVIFNLQNGNSEILYTRYYHKFAALANENSDSLLAFESGNALAWYRIAERENSDSAWKRAVIYGARKQELAPLIFSKYAERIGAKWVRYLPLSSELFYPKMFSDANWLFVSDAGSQSLLRFSLETGIAGEEISLPKDKKYTVAHEEPPWLMLNSGNSLLRFSLREQKSVSLEMTGKPFSFLRNKDSVYVGLWNGFVLKYLMPDMRLEWSNKVSSAEVLLARGEMGIYSLSQGKVTLLSAKTQLGKEISLDMGGVVYFKSKNDIFAIASAEGNVQFFSEKENFKQLGAFSLRSPIVSFELLENSGKVYVLAGAVNQALSLYEVPSGNHIWTFNSKGSVYMQPVLHGSHIWLDQDGSVVAIDINSGKIAKKHDIFGSGASISIHGNTLYCSTPQKLLYAFPL